MIGIVGLVDEHGLLAEATAHSRRFLDLHSLVNVGELTTARVISILIIGIEWSRTLSLLWLTVAHWTIVTNTAAIIIMITILMMMLIVDIAII